MVNVNIFKPLSLLCMGSLVFLVPVARGQQSGGGGTGGMTGASMSGAGTSSSSGSQAGTSGSGATSGSSSGGGGGGGAQQLSAQYQASVPEGTATSTPIPLSLEEAITRGLRNNLGLLTNQQAGRQSRAQRLQSLSALLPNVNGQVNATEQQINLAAQGFNVSIPPSAGFRIPTIVGPYNYESARANATLPIFNWSNISSFRSSKQSVKASLLDIKNARDLVVVAVGYGYLQIIEDAARVVATKAEIESDNAVYVNASRRHDAGVATAIDVTRSLVELKQRQQALVAQQNQFAKDKLLLGRTIGLPLGQDFNVTDPSPNVPLTAISLPEALNKAYASRPDYQAAKARVKAAEFTLGSSKAERYPTLQAQGYYGVDGLQLFTNSHGVFQATGGVSFNIFDGGRIRGDILQSNAQLVNARNDLGNLRGQIDNDVRSALLDLQSARDQVNVAQSNVVLANQTLTQSRDRFAAGVTNTVEVVQSQQTVADANDNLISAQYQLNVGKVELARALGVAEEGIKNYFSHRQP